MKKTFMSFLLAAITAITFCSCKDKEAPTGGTAEGAPAPSRTFTVGFDAEFPPYGFRADDGSYQGFDLSLATEVAARNNWEIVLKPIDWAAKDGELNSGTIDCIWNGFTMTDERLEQYTWSEPYVSNKQVVMVKANSGIKTLADLKGKSIVVQDGSSGAEAIEEFLKNAQVKDASFKFKELKKVPQYATTYMLLDSDAVDAVGLDSAVAARFVVQSNNKFAIVPEDVKAELFGIGFKKGNTELRDQVQATLKEMVADGTCEKILDYWRENGGDAIDFILK